jgi:DNA excision repair protein ERCC-2
MINGRADFIRKRDDGVTEIIELKSIALPPVRFAGIESPPPQFELQLQIYAYLLSREKSLAPDVIEATLLLKNLADLSRRTFRIEWSAGEVEAVFDRELGSMLEQSRLQLLELRRRKAIGRNIRFPFPEIRPEQEEIGNTVEQALAEGSHCILEAAPGVGKSVAVMMPLLQTAMVNGAQLFMATAKGGGRNPIRKAAESFIAQAPRLRVLILSSQEQTCREAEFRSLCETCPRLGVEQESEFNIPAHFDSGGIVDLNRIIEAASSNGLCALELSRKLVGWCDVLVGDINFLFDPGATLAEFAGEEPLNWYLGVDEAHNLPGRARENWSSLLELETLPTSWKTIEDDLWRFSDAPAASKIKSDYINLMKRASKLIEEASWDDEAPTTLALTRLKPSIDALIMSAGRLLAWAGERFDEDARKSLFTMIGQLTQFLEAGSIESPESILLADPEASSLRILCRSAGPKLARRIDRLKGAVFFSGTLTPLEQFKRELGPVARPVALNRIAPRKAQDRRLEVIAVAGVDTRYKERPANVRKIARTVSSLARISPGAVLAVFPSFEFIGWVYPDLENSGINIHRQTPLMDHAERLEFRASLARSSLPAVALVTAGGQFTEAEDYPGDTCVGVVMAGPCMPPPGLELESLCSYWDEKGENGFEIAYIHPAVRKVVQAAGRILRSDSDRGVLLLLDDRFKREPILGLLPIDWQSQVERESDNWIAQVEEFWRSKNGS